jgi:hypothetical protein
MPARRHDQVRPLETGQGQQFRVAVERLGGDAQVGAAVENPIRDLRRTALLDVQADRRVALTKRWITGGSV